MQQGDWQNAVLFGLSVAVGLVPEMVCMCVPICVFLSVSHFIHTQTTVAHDCEHQPQFGCQHYEPKQSPGEAARGYSEHRRDDCAVHGVCVCVCVCVSSSCVAGQNRHVDGRSRDGVRHLRCERHTEPVCVVGGPPHCKPADRVCVVLCVCLFAFVSDSVLCVCECRFQNVLDAAISRKGEEAKIVHSPFEKLGEIPFDFAVRFVLWLCLCLCVLSVCVYASCLCVASSHECDRQAGCRCVHSFQGRRRRGLLLVLCVVFLFSLVCL